MTEATTSADGVSLLIEHAVRPEARARYEAWLREATQRAASFPGHQGVHVIRPAPGAHRFAIVVRFATMADATRWTTSAERRAMIAELGDALAEDEATALTPGIEFWFQPPATAAHKARPWKQWLITTSVIWPLTMVVPLALRPLFAAVPALGAFGVSHLLTAATIVAIVTWIVMPRYVRAVSGWLFL